MNAALRSALAVAGLAFATQAAAQIVFYENEGFQGRSFNTDKQVGNFERYGFNDRASSVVVLRERWEVCEDTRFAGRCVILRPGRYASLAALGLNDRVSSARIMSRNARVEDNRYAPQPVAVYDNQRRNNERVFNANVTSVREVFGAAEQRCWIEHQQQGTQDRGGANVPGAIVGAVIGGVLGHQVGGGRGQDIATVGGAIAGGAVGANVGRGSGQGYSQDVQRCATPNQGRIDHYDVTYNFRGTEHRIQMTSPPGQTVTVNSQGEPRA